MEADCRHRFAPASDGLWGNEECILGCNVLEGVLGDREHGILRCSFLLRGLDGRVRPFVRAIWNFGTVEDLAGFMALYKLPIPT